MNRVQASQLVPSMFIAHEPQIPSRQARRNVSVGSIFRLPTFRHPLARAHSILIRRDKPLQMTLLPGGPSLALARYPPSLATLVR